MRRGGGDKRGGSPRWMTTFADLMAVLVVFFVMLYSMSVIEEYRFQQMAEALREVLGPAVIGDTQRQPSPTLVDLDGEPFDPLERPRVIDRDVDEFRQLDEIRETLREALAEEIEQGVIELGEQDDGVLLRFEERAAFELARKEIDEGFIPVLRRIGVVLQETPGLVRVAGHSDDLPIRTERFRSNFDLSTARAVSVVHVLEEAGVPSSRLIAQGHADTRPLVPNTSAENRARNRRVEIILTEGGAPGETGETGETD
ncbi:flagellar motor protein MotB [Halorhodospira abdelmalekii]|uniref:flagellar motor protein MotB n=1 Tax=Halorhodospira abdelmalekii TaxID=421629 RepID=UPI00190618D0|nr:flagellar motor protein MotB [Halorhodospira abdelmalekii]MBK1734767.1 flagellar motor protein MotB [Halorhodospira abdelmalekii]